MGVRTSYPPGTFSWVDLATTDAVGARAFYSALFGWTVDNHVCRLDGAAVSAFSSLPPDAPVVGTAPGWTSYVTVESADATAARVVELGGRVVLEAFDVTDAGRMSLLEDPQGATFAVWEARARVGADRVNDVGCLCMNELVTPDLDAARPFYEKLFAWTTAPVDTGPGGPTVFSVHNGPALNAHMGEEPGPPHWRVYFTVESAAATIAQLERLGGSVLAGPMPIPDGSIAVVCDPEGAEFALFEGETDP